MDAKRTDERFMTQTHNPDLREEGAMSEPEETPEQRAEKFRQGRENRAQARRAIVTDLDGLLTISLRQAREGEADARWGQLAHDVLLTKLGMQAGRL